MMEIDTAILVLTGFSHPPYRTEGAGLWSCYDRLMTIFRDRKDWLAVRTWNAKVEHDADELVRRKAKRIIVLCYSWGCGRACKRFCKQLRKHDVWVDLVIFIDPVVYDGLILGKIANALLPGRSKFKCPDNVHFYVSFRTVNKTKLTQPWGRDIEAEWARPLERIAFGSKENLKKWEPAGTHVEDANVTHTNIDNDPRVHDKAIDHIVKFVTEGEAA